MPATQTAPTSRHLQSVGQVSAKPASMFIAGDVMVWNFGCRSLVLSVREVSACYLEFTLQSERGSFAGPLTSVRKIKKERAVCFSSSPWSE